MMNQSLAHLTLKDPKRPESRLLTLIFNRQTAALEAVEVQFDSVRRVRTYTGLDAHAIVNSRLESSLHGLYFSALFNTWGGRVYFN